MHIEMPLADILAWPQIESVLSDSDMVSVNLASFINSVVVGIDILALLIWTAGLVGLFFLWLRGYLKIWWRREEMNNMKKMLVVALALGGLLPLGLCVCAKFKWMVGYYGRGF